MMNLIPSQTDCDTHRHSSAKYVAVSVSEDRANFVKQQGKDCVEYAEYAYMLFDFTDT